MENENIKTTAEYTLRIPNDAMDKLYYIASYNNRPLSRELRALILNFIQEFEVKHGKIFITEEIKNKIMRRKRTKNNTQA